jgi:hypothetical protein
VDAFGGKIERSINPKGELEISVVTLPADAAGARTTALHAQQEARHRLRCLRYMEDHDPQAVREVVQSIMLRPQEDPQVLLYLLGRRADDPDEPLLARDVLPRLRVPDDADKLAKLIEYGRNLDGWITRGAGLGLRQMDAPTARQRLIVGGMAPGHGWQEQHGLMLRVLALQDTCSLLVEAAGKADTTNARTAAIMMLGCLGDEGAIPYLSKVIREHQGEENGLANRAAMALGTIGTPSALQACMDLALEGLSQSVLIDSVAYAVMDQPKTYWVRSPLPVWARPMTPSEARATVLPLALRLKAGLPQLWKQIDPIVQAAASSG